MHTPPFTIGQIPTAPISTMNLPVALQGLATLAMNLRWTWRSQTQALFHKVSGGEWNPQQSPVEMLRNLRDLDALANDKDFIAAIDAELKNLSDYLASGDDTWFVREKKSVGSGPVAYFCAEYSFHHSMNQYAGGLGILAGDHVKEASDLGLPFVGIGLFYRRGFFHQVIDREGRQEAVFPVLDPVNYPLHQVVKPGTSEPLTISLLLKGRTVTANVWMFAVGRTPLLVLDTDLESNHPEDRKISSQLYTAGREMRLHQEFVLGVGGMKVLRALGIEPSSYHMNEGHSALLLLEQLHHLVENGSDFEAARKAITPHAIITIHTPVPEGNERFGADLARTVLSPMLEGSKIDVEEILKLGRGADEDPEIFDMTAFGLRHSQMSNGVSLLHGRTAHKTWSKATGMDVIGVTNGVHMPTWIGPEISCLYHKHGLVLERETDLLVGPGDRPVWEKALDLNDEEFWAAHQEQKRRLIAWAQERLFKQHARHGEGPSQLAEFAECLDPDAFLIGFARRFATYKRAGLLFSDLKRASKLFEAKGRKVQILFAGKAHHSDRGGQKVVEQVYKLTQTKRFKGRAFLLEDYDMETGRMLVQGVDMWLNNPRRPLEASGTSGMKAAANGIPNTSILDGWWDEGFVDGKDRNGWAIGGRKEFKDLKEQDAADAAALYEVMEQHVIPTFFNRDASGLPREWIKVMKQAVATSAYSFSTARMIRDYVDLMYGKVGK